MEIEELEKEVEANRIDFLLSVIKQKNNEIESLKKQLGIFTDKNKKQESQKPNQNARSSHL